MLEPDLIEFLSLSLPGVTGGVHLGNIPQNQPVPAVAIENISGSTPRTLGNTALFSRADIQITVVGDERYSTVLPVANQIRALLDGYKGTFTTTKIESCRCLADPADSSVVDGTKIIRALTLDFKFTYRNL